MCTCALSTAMPRIPSTAEGALACTPCPVGPGAASAGVRTRTPALFSHALGTPPSLPLFLRQTHALYAPPPSPCATSTGQGPACGTRASGVRARLRPSDEECCTGDGCDRMIPLE